MSAVDISRAYFNASTEGSPPTYVQLPPEDPNSGRGMCGFLMKHMNGTQAAADGWQQKYTGYMIELGFRNHALYMLPGFLKECPHFFWHWHI